MKALSNHKSCMLASVADNFEIYGNTLVTHWHMRVKGHHIALSAFLRKLLSRLQDLLASRK